MFPQQHGASTPQQQQYRAPHQMYPQAPKSKAHALKAHLQKAMEMPEWNEVRQVIIDELKLYEDAANFCTKYASQPAYSAEMWNTSDYKGYSPDKPPDCIQCLDIIFNKGNVHGCRSFESRKKYVSDAIMSLGKEYEPLAIEYEFKCNLIIQHAHNQCGSVSVPVQHACCGQ